MEQLKCPKSPPRIGPYLLKERE